METRDKRMWESEYQCAGCGECYISEGRADSCCEVGIYELSICSWCENHIDFCECVVPPDLEG